MTEESDNEHRPKNGKMADVNRTEVSDDLPQDRMVLRHFDDGEELEHDFYDKSIAASDKDSLTGESEIANSDEQLGALEDISVSGNVETGDMEFFDLGTPTATTVISKLPKKIDESDAIVQFLRHGEKMTHDQPYQAASSSDSNDQKIASSDQDIASSGKRFFARSFDLMFLLLVLISTLALFLKLVQSHAHVQITQNLIVQLSLAILLLPLALILEAAILSDFGNTPGKHLLGLRITHNGQDKIKFRQYLARNCLLWFKGLACGIPFLSGLALLWQHFKLAKIKVTSYDKSMNMQVIAETTSLIRKVLFMFLGILMAVFLNYFIVTSVTPVGIFQLWDSVKLIF